MKTAFEELRSPYLDPDVELAVPSYELSRGLQGVMGESPFVAKYREHAAEPIPGAPIEAEGGTTGDDGRKEVRDTTIPPYLWICSVSYEKDGQTLNGGTGFLISNRHVLTARHVISEAGSGPAAPSIYVYPARHYGGEPFGGFSVARTRLSASPTLDYGLITLNRPVDQGVLWWGAPGTKTAWWSEALVPAQLLLRTAVPISTAGYPGVKDAYRRRMYNADGSTMPGSFGAVFRHTAATTQGQSGSPIWTVRNGLYVLLGIATSYDQMPGQRATWVGVLRRDVERWMGEDAPRVTRRIAIEIPYRWICRLEVYDNDLRRVEGYGTGLLISNRHVLTAARVIHEYSRDRRKYSVRITPAYEFGKEAFGSTTAANARVSPKFSPETKDGSADYGLLTLSRPLGSAVFSSIGKTALGSWGNESHGLSTTPADLSGKPAHLAAFSRSFGGGGGYHKLRVCTGDIVGLQRGQILHKASSKLDAPGAPIWIEAGKRRLLVGIASSVFSKDSGLNLGCYLSQETQTQLTQWVNVDHDQTEREREVHSLSQDELEVVLASPDSEGAPGELEDNEWLEPEEAREELEEWQLTSEADQEEDEFLDDEGALIREDETELESPEGFAEEESDLEGLPEYSSPEVSRLEPESNGFEEEEEGDFEEARVGAADGEIAPWAAGIDPFPGKPTVRFSVDDKRMKKAFAPVTVSTPMPVCTALVDLTGNPAMPPYAGVYDDELIFGGSVPKICVMYAAFALRSRVQAFINAAAVNGVSITAPRIIAEIEKVWKPKLHALFPTRPALSFGNKQDITFPKLDQIFTFSPDGKVDFKRAAPAFTDARIDHVGESGAPKGLFHEWMRSMLRWSNNAAASKCILALGYFYLNGALSRAGLFDSTTSKGLWLSADYKGHDWVKTNADKRANAAGPPLTPRWAAAQGRRRSNITATAAQVARFMTLLAQDKLVDATADQEMRALLKADAGGLGSDANDALRRVGRTPSSVIAKFGLGDDEFRHECAIIERTVAGKDLHYVAVGLGYSPKRKPENWFELFVLLDETIVERNK